jgi:hypothetical protein
MEQPATPTLDRMREIHDQSQPIGEFLEWLQWQHVHLMTWQEIEEEDVCSGQFSHSCYGGKTRERRVRDKNGTRTDDWEPDPRSFTCERCGGTGRVIRKRETWVPDGRSIEQLLAAYFGIDLDAASRERQAVYEAVAALAAQDT